MSKIFNVLVHNLSGLNWVIFFSTYVSSNVVTPQIILGTFSSIPPWASTAHNFFLKTDIFIRFSNATSYIQFTLTFVSAVVCHFLLQCAATIITKDGGTKMSLFHYCLISFDNEIVTKTNLLKVFFWYTYTFSRLEIKIFRKEANIFVFLFPKTKFSKQHMGSGWSPGDRSFGWWFLVISSL